MGSENLFHKRKAKTEKDLARQKAKRFSYEKVLIICEGEKTEPNYFNELKDHYELNSANVVVDGKCGSDPWSLYQYARKCVQNSDKENDSYDKIYCVFDKDKHTTYQQTLDAITRAKYFTAIVSVPCFEYWLLLHFVYTTKPINAVGNHSSCDNTIEELKKYMPDYRKAYKGIFSQLMDKLDFAKENSQRAVGEALINDTDNPSTRIHELVEFLQKLKTQK